MHRAKKYIAFSLTGIIAYGFILINGNSTTETKAVIPSKHKGVCWVGQREAVTGTEIKVVKDIGVNWISQTPFGWQRNANDTLIRGETSAQTPWWGESKQGLIATTMLARKEGIKTLLKPHLWIRDSWPGEIEMKSEQEWKSWFRNYENFILPYAILADSIGIEILCIGTELHKTVKRPEWVVLIKKIKGLYSGKLTYAANFSGEFEDVPFWNDLDYIGVQAYFPLAATKNPGMKEIVQGWKTPIKQMEKVHQRFNKPILFTELGYKSTPDAAMEPWRWPEQEEEISFETQERCYEAFFQTVWPLDWVAGVYFWKWYPHAPRRPTKGDFTPQGSPAEAVMRSWFKKDS